MFSHVTRRVALTTLRSARCWHQLAAPRPPNTTKPLDAAKPLAAFLSTNSDDNNDDDAAPAEKLDDADLLARDISDLGEGFLRRSTAARGGGDSAARMAQATSAGDLMYSGDRPDNWEALLAEARAAYPERAGPRRNNHRKREAARFKAIRRQHRVAKEQRILAHHAAMLRRSKLAVERRGWDGPRLPAA